MLKRTLACALFAITGHAYSADIQVTTLVDEDKDDAVCSLREAVEFLNKRSQKEFENGYRGCGNKDASSTIILQRDQTYQLNSAVNIKAAMTIRTASSEAFNDNKQGLNNATIKMQGSDRLFVIDDGNVESTQLLVGFIELNLQGASSKVNDGGLILNRENLSIQYSRLSGGSANRGGAIYNVGVASDAKNTAGYVSINNSILQNNKADQGAVVYSEMPMYLITQSVVRDNEGIAGTNGALLYVQTGFNNDTIAGALAARSSGIRSSTIFHNKGGYVANIREGMILNNNTIIKNAAGLYLQSLNRKVTTTENGETKVQEFPSSYVSNSILVANGNANCGNTSDDTTVVQSNLTTSDCDRNAEKRLPNFMWNQNDPEQALIAGGSNDEGICAAPPAKGLLCPYSIPKDQMLGFFKPRLLTSYKQLSDSLIVNKGRIYSDGTSFSVSSCEATDQRGKSRTGFNELCDLGSIELTVDRSNIAVAGMDIRFKQVAKFSIADNLLDGELLDPNSCEQLLGKRSDGQAWRYGCLDIVQNQTPSKGKVTLDQDGNVTYTPDSDWHGADIFKMRIMTTITRFNNVTNYYIEIPTNIVQDPPDTFQSKTVNVGSFSWGAILALFGLIGLRRLKS
ncbi:rhombotarget A [Acinetobacter sp. Tr-809]|uniref:rhombotarget A n=1 Tax=Acinetobacter sp. Tr-809 TaxID=2608324 RepID=UPI0014219CFB|nr:rhombotarget A [Acinetobacter sp. Tr-809]NIE96135.1 rhombotarget A [Acinetobacter sp. Tr-809]